MTVDQMLAAEGLGMRIVGTPDSSSESAVSLCSAPLTAGGVQMGGEHKKAACG